MTISVLYSVACSLKEWVSLSLYSAVFRNVFTSILRVSFSSVVCSLKECVYTNTEGPFLLCILQCLGMCLHQYWGTDGGWMELVLLHCSNRAGKLWGGNSCKQRHIWYEVFFKASSPTFKLNKQINLRLETGNFLYCLWILPPTVTYLNCFIWYNIDYHTANNISRYKRTILNILQRNQTF